MRISKAKIKFIVTTIIVVTFIIFGCSPKQISNFRVIGTDSIVSLTINPRDVTWVTRVGGLNGSRWKVLLAQKDYNTISKIVTLVNSIKKTDFNPKDYGSGKAINNGYRRIRRNK